MYTVATIPLGLSSLSPHLYRMDPESHFEGKRPTPLPYGQLFLALLIQSSEAITATVIYPFIAQLIRSIGITGGDEAKVGYYAGVIVSLTTVFIPFGRPMLIGVGRNPSSSSLKAWFAITGVVHLTSMEENRFC